MPDYPFVRRLLQMPRDWEDRTAFSAAAGRLSFARLRADMLGFAGVEIHRRILGLAHNADFETIADENLRAICEAKALKFGRHICVNRKRIHGLDEINALAARIEKEIVA